MAVFSSRPTLLAVGRRGGAVDQYDAASGRLLASFRLEAGLRCLVPMRRLGCLAAVHEGRNSVTIWDAQADRVVQLDFSAELESMGRRLSKMTFACFDDARSVLLCGDDAGSIFVRSVARIRETDDLAVKLVRVAAPAPTASAPTRVTSLWLDARGDLAFTGDASGLVRVVPHATGVAWKALSEEDRLAAEAGEPGVELDAIFAQPASAAALAASAAATAAAAATAGGTPVDARRAPQVRDLSVAKRSPAGDAALGAGAASVAALNAARAEVVAAAEAPAASPPS
jgi:hypothetical protein